MFKLACGYKSTLKHPPRKKFRLRHWFEPTFLPRGFRSTRFFRTTILSLTEWCPEYDNKNGAIRNSFLPGRTCSSHGENPANPGGLPATILLLSDRRRRLGLRTLNVLRTAAKTTSVVSAGLFATIAKYQMITMELFAEKTVVRWRGPISIRVLFLHRCTIFSVTRLLAVSLFFIRPTALYGFFVKRTRVTHVKKTRAN